VPIQWSKEASVSFMDDAGIDVAIVSLSRPGVHTGDSAKARTLARRCNEFSAELDCKGHRSSERRVSREALGCDRR